MYIHCAVVRTYPAVRLMDVYLKLFWYTAVKHSNKTCILISLFYYLSQVGPKKSGSITCCYSFGICTVCYFIVIAHNVD